MVPTSVFLSIETEYPAHAGEAYWATMRTFLDIGAGSILGYGRRRALCSSGLARWRRVAPSRRRWRPLQPTMGKTRRGQTGFIG